MEHPLNYKQERFVHEFLIDHNARQAAIRAGYSAKSQGGQAADLMRDPRVRARIHAGMEALFAKLNVTAERALRERVRVAFFDPRKLFDDESKILPLHMLDEDTLAALTINYDLRNDEVMITRVRSPNRNPALTALEKMMTLSRSLAVPEELLEPEEVAQAAGAAEQAQAAGGAVNVVSLRREEAEPKPGALPRRAAPGLPPLPDRVPLGSLPQPPEPAAPLSAIAAGVRAAAQKMQRVLSAA